MLDTFRIYTELKEGMEAAAAEKIASMIGLLYDELRQSVTKNEFNDLKAVVKDLAEAQKVTEMRLAELGVAQKASEKRLTRLEEVITELGDTQNRLAKAQEKTEKTVQQLARQVGGLSDVVGGDLEEIAYIVLHDVLKRELGWQVGVLERAWQTWGQEPEEVDIFGQANDPKEPSKTIWIVGEAKHNISIKEVKKFIKQVERAREHLSCEIFPVVFCYRARPEVQQMIIDSGIRLVFSYGKLL